MARFLSEYPRPAADTGWGFHDSSGASARPQDVTGFARYLYQDLGTRWFKALVSGTNKVDLVHTLVQQGIEVVIRLYAERPHPHYVVSEGDVRAYVQAGAHYFEWGNEPNLVLEWDRGFWVEGARVDKVCQQFLRNADVIRRAGGIPLLPALSPGGDYPHRDWYRTTFEWLRSNGHLADLDGAALAIHNRPSNRPLAFIDSTGSFFLDYEWIDDLVRSYVGRSLPLLATEAGYEPSRQQDATFAPIDPQRHAAFNVEILRGFGPYGGRRWRDSLFCQCMWLVDGFGHRDYSEAAWHNNPIWAGGGNLPAVDALRAEWQAHPFERQWSWQSGRADYAEATWRGTPNMDARPAGTKPSLIVLHPAGGSFYEALARLQNPANRASFHYLVARTGSISQLVPEAARAWHAGDATWQKRRVNDISIAVALADGSGGYPAVQLEKAAVLVGHLAKKYGLALQDVVTMDMIGGNGAKPWLDMDAFLERLGGVPKSWPSIETVRAAAWAAAHIPYKADAVFACYAREHQLGNPETTEFDFELNGCLYRGQGFSEGVIFAEVGKWDNIRLRPW